jgi:hypothetical protein
MSQTETSTGPVWAQMGDYGVDDSMLVGNREGLIVVRDAIILAIEKGECSIPDEGVEISGVRRVDDPLEAQEESVGSKWAGVGCLALIAVCFMIFIFGLVELLCKLI